MYYIRIRIRIICVVSLPEETLKSLSSKLACSRIICVVSLPEETLKSLSSLRFSVLQGLRFHGTKTKTGGLSFRSTKTKTGS